jgi:putative ABC transport system substrate-binding protein
MLARLIRRRDFTALAGAAAALAVPYSLRAQQQATLSRIFWISTESPPDPFIDGFREGMRKRGYVEGSNYVIDARYASDVDKLQTVLSDVNRDKVDLVVSSGPATRVLRGMTGVPVLFAISGDPIELGLVKSLARPESNFTGSTFLSLDLAGKRVEMLNTIFPKVRKLAVLSWSQHPGEHAEWNATQAAAGTLGIETVRAAFASGREIDSGLAIVRDAHADAMLTFPEGVSLVHRAKIAEFAIAEGLPSMFGWSEYCDAGGLLSYGANQRAAYVRLAIYADRILRGESPANLPVEQPTKFELVVNLKTARALKIDVPPSILLRAERVIE